MYIGNGISFNGVPFAGDASYDYGVVTEGLKLWLPLTQPQTYTGLRYVSDISENDLTSVISSNSSYRLDGVNDYIGISDTPAENWQTIAFWIKPLSSGANEGLIYRGGSTLGTKLIRLDSLVVESINNNIYMDVYVNGVLEGQTFGGSAATLTINSWQRVVLVSTDGGFIGDSAVTLIGHGIYSSYSNFEISDFQVYSSLWDADDIAYDLANPEKLVIDNPSSSIVAADILHYYSFTETDGDELFNSGSNGNGAAYGGVWSLDTYYGPQMLFMDLAEGTNTAGDTIYLPPDPTNPTEDINGNTIRTRDNAMNAFTNSGFIMLNTTSALDMGYDDFTMETWIEYTSTSSAGHIVFELGAADLVNRASIKSTDSNRMIFSIGGLNYTTPTNTFTPGTWYHICMVRDGLNMKVYVDGTLLNTQTLYARDISDYYPKYVSEGTYGYNNLISDCRAYDIALSSTQVTQNYTAGPSAMFIGAEKQGGVVFYVDEVNEIGYVVAKENSSTDVEWGCMGTTLTGASGTAIGTGLQNTLDIVAECSETPIAASLTAEYEADGFTDWYLPSKDLLVPLNNERATLNSLGIPDFTAIGVLYWSSSQRSNDEAWARNFSTETSYIVDKDTSYWGARAVRHFHYGNPIVGQARDGGVVFYVDAVNRKAYVSSTEDLPSLYSWGCKGTNISGADGTAIGTGYQNTLDIVAGCSDTPIAASEALAYEYNSYSDWYLPSEDELTEMCTQKAVIGGFGNDVYLSSTELYANVAMIVSFFGCTSSMGMKDNPYYVRLIRSFNY
jgi:hypothetical protein